ncbi:MAG: hypothetical protein KC635_05675, partial [Myxococcales bacterium]|nr:hypothetical protein [Myxococcales bacterium]
TGDADDATASDADDATTGDADDATASDASDGDAPDGSIEADVVDPCSGAHRPSGCDCAQDEQCASAFCAVGVEGSTCVDTCEDTNDCAAGEVCVLAPGQPDGICLVPADLLCTPCTTDLQCRVAGGTNRCVSFGAAGGFCGTTCGGDGDCPDGFSCASGQCTPLSGMCECTDVALELGATTACTLTNGVGTCTGQRSCGPAGLSACDARAATLETCNDVDDDCDGFTDNASGLCNDGNPCTSDACTGGVCGHTDATGSCSDGDMCTSGDHCEGGECVGTPSCECQTAADCTSPPPGSDSECIAIACADHVCTYTATTGSCSDDDACTTGDTCGAGGACAGTPKSCDDSDPCTLDICAADGQCLHNPTTGACEDGDPCTVDDSCVTGVCQGVTLDCSGYDDSCHVGVCSGDGGCVAQPVACGILGVRLHVPSTTFSQKGSGTFWFIGSAGEGGPVGRSSNGTHTIRFGFHPGIPR